MDTWMVVAIVVAAVVVVGLAAFAGVRRRQARSRRLEQRFGPEYGRVVEDGDRREAEQELEQRLDRRAGFEVRPLSADSRERYAADWRDVQARFVDDPEGTVREADRLLQQVMTERGYPGADAEQRAADLSVDYPDAVERYRSAGGVVGRLGNGVLPGGDGRPSTDELRTALVDYRALMEELLVDERVRAA